MPASMINNLPQRSSQTSVTNANCQLRFLSIARIKPQSPHAPPPLMLPEPPSQTSVTNHNRLLIRSPPMQICLVTMPMNTFTSSVLRRSLTPTFDSSQASVTTRSVCSVAAPHHQR
jgi:hypothetical protein